MHSNRKSGNGKWITVLVDNASEFCGKCRFYLLKYSTNYSMAAIGNILRFASQFAAKIGAGRQAGENLLHFFVFTNHKKCLRNIVKLTKVCEITEYFLFSVSKLV